MILNCSKIECAVNLRNPTNSTVPDGWIKNKFEYFGMLGCTCRSCTSNPKKYWLETDKINNIQGTIVIHSNIETPT